MPIEMTRFDVQDHLKSPEQRAAYIEAALESEDPSLIALDLGDVARAHGVTSLARETGISRETIYKTFKAGGNPTIAKVAKALGLRLAVVPA